MCLKFHVVIRINDPVKVSIFNVKLLKYTHSSGMSVGHHCNRKLIEKFFTYEWRLSKWTKHYGCCINSIWQGKNSTSSSQAPEDGFSDFELESLERHNVLRSKHDAAALKLDRELCTMAQRYAERLAELGRMEHSKPENRRFHGKPSGENLAYSVSFLLPGLITENRRSPNISNFCNNTIAMIK